MYHMQLPCQTARRPAAAVLIMAQIVTLGPLPLSRPAGREVLECGGWSREAGGLTPLWPTGGGLNRKRCVPSPLTHRTPKR
jgi:hypothetical protein